MQRSTAMQRAAAAGLHLRLARLGLAAGALAGGGLAGCGAATPADTQVTAPQTTTPATSTAASATTPTSDAATAARDAAIDAAIAHPDRWGEDRARDADRRPGEVLRFFDVRPGMKVAELMSGRGYYAELLSRVVGPQGLAYVQNNKFVLEKFAAAPLAERLGRGGLGNVRRVDRELHDLGLPAGELDAVLMILFYHDTYWMGVDRKAMLAGVFAALRPGGVFGIVDHAAAAGAGTSAVKTLHRVERGVVQAEIEAAGFVLEASSDALAHPEDDHSVNVFDPAIRGKTDRFVLRFRKPAP